MVECREYMCILTRPRLRPEATRQSLYLAFSFYTIINQLHGVIMLARFLNQRFKMMAVLQYHRKIGKMRKVMQLKKRQLRKKKDLNCNIISSRALIS